MATRTDTCIEIADNPTWTLLNKMSRCGEKSCPVQKYTPKYPLPNLPHNEAYIFGPSPVIPVVPTRIRKRKVMVLGMYPTARYLVAEQITPNSGLSGDVNDREVPIRDINEPFEETRYFNGYCISHVRAGTTMQQEYFSPLGLRLPDLWITNTVKCFLFKESHVEKFKKIHQSVGQSLNDEYPGFRQTRYPFADAAKVCMAKWLVEEIRLCDPKLIIALGEEICRLIHGDENFEPTGDALLFNKLIDNSPLLRQGAPSPNGQRRHAAFFDRNILFLNHPSRIAQDDNDLERHRRLVEDLRNEVQQLVQL